MKVFQETYHELGKCSRIVLISIHSTSITEISLSQQKTKRFTMKHTQAYLAFDSQ